MYFLVIRPQSKKQKELQKMLSELKKGDDVVTQGGIIGKVSGIKDNELTLQVQEGVRVRVLRSAVTGIYPGPGARRPRPRSKPKRRNPTLLKATDRHGTKLVVEGGSLRSRHCDGRRLLVPTVVPEEKQPAFFKRNFQKRIQLGLDLQGGLHLVYEVNVDKAVSDKVDRLSSDVEDRLRQGQGGRRPRRQPGRARRHRRSRSSSRRSRPSWTTRC